MSKEELEKEAGDKGVKYADSLKMDIKVEEGVSCYAWYQVEQAYEKGALDFAEPREKQIQIDAEQIRVLQKQNGELTDENERLKGDLELWESGACRATNLDKCGVVKELEAQIEKMKCCYNCKHSRAEYEHCRTDKHEKWEIKNENI